MQISGIEFFFKITGKSGDTAVNALRTTDPPLS